MKTENGQDVLMYIDSEGFPAQTHIKLTEKQYAHALRAIVEHCVEDLGLDDAGWMVAYAVFRNNLPSDLSDYCVS